MLHNRTRLLKLMDEQQLDYIIASSPENFYYLSELYSLNHWQVKGTQAFVVYPRDEAKNPIIVMPQCDLDILADCPSWITDIKSYGKCIIEEVGNPNLTETDKRYKYLRSKADGFASAMEALIAAFKKLKYNTKERIGFDERNVPFTFIKEFENVMGTTVEAANSILQKTRLIKTPEEIRRLHKSVQITEQSIRSTLERTQIGMTEKEILKIYYEEIAKRGALPSLNCIGVGGHSAYANSQVTKRKLKRDQLIRFDIGCIYEFYHSDTAQNAVFGTLSDRHYEYFDAIKNGIALGISQMKPGVKAATIFHTIMDGIKKTIPHYDRHHVGHGIGIEVYDPPMITPNADWSLAENMVFCVEAPYYEFEFGGLQVEEVVRVIADGVEILSQRPVEIIVL